MDYTVDIIICQIRKLYDNIHCDFAIDLQVTTYSAAVTLVFSECTDVRSKRREVFETRSLLLLSLFIVLFFQ